MVSRRKKKAKGKGKGKPRRATNAKEERAAFKPFPLKQFKKSSCTHGWNHADYPGSHDCHKFIKTAVEAFRRSEHVYRIIEAAEDSTCEKYPEIWKDPTQLEWIASAFVSIGVEAMLGREDNEVGKKFLCASSTGFSEYLRQHVVCELHKAVPALYWARLDELLNTNSRRPIRYLRKRIPCSCLDVQNFLMKRLPKMGLCCNRQSENDSCNLPYSMVAFSDMWSCERCRRAHYCSIECQAADWPNHKEYCKVWSEWQSNQDSDQTEYIETS